MSALTPKEAIEIIAFSEVTSRQYGPTLLKLREAIKAEEFAEEFLEMDGLNEVLKVATRKDISSAVQGMMLKVTVGLLVYENALDQVEDSQELVDRIFSILNVHGVTLGAAKPTLDILVVLCGTLAEGYKMVKNAALAKHSVTMKPWSCLADLLTTDDLTAVKPALLLLNLLLKKTKQFEDDLAVKELLFQWKDCNLMDCVRTISDKNFGDPDIKKGLHTFQQLSNVTIPRSWEAAAKFQQKYEELRQRNEEQGEQLFVFQQQQAKMRLLKQELSKAQETIKALNLFAPGASTNYHPSKRFADGGGIPLTALCSDNKVELDQDVNTASREISLARKTIFEQFVKSNEFRPAAEKIFGGRPAAGGRNRRLDPLAGLGAEDSEFFAPPPDDEWGPPPDDDFDAPPPDDDFVPPPPDDDFDAPPPDDDFGPPPDDGAPPTATNRTAGGGSGRSVQAAKSSQARYAELESQALAAGGRVVAGPDGTPMAVDAQGQQLPPPSLGETLVSSTAPAPATDAATPEAAPTPSEQAAPEADPAVAAEKTAAPVPSPQVAAPVAGGPPPPPPGKFGIGKAGPKKDEKQWFHGKAPVKKMKPFHWEKQAMPAGEGTLWHRVHESKEYNISFDYEEFESMYSQKEVEKVEKKEAKPKKVLLLDSQVFMNLSIMLHKLPTIPNIQRAIIELDDETLSRDSLMAIVAQCPPADVVKLFKAQADKKPVDEYEPPEQFVALSQSLPAFKQRCTSWLFSMDFEENTASMFKPINRLSDAIVAVLESKHLPYILGLLLAFGNMMNYGNNMKGNAAAIPISTLSKLDATKDNRGKISLMAHLFSCIKKENPDAMDLHEELKPIMNNVQNIKMEDLEKGVSECERDLKQFKMQVETVKKQLEKLGADPEDGYLPKMAEFTIRAEAQLQEVTEAMKACADKFANLIKYLGAKNTMKAEELFGDLVPFVERVKKEAAEAAKDKKRQQKKGKKVGNELTDVVGKLQESMVS